MLGMGVVPSALKNFEQDEIADQEWFPCNGFLQFGGSHRAMAAQVRDPDGAIDKNHDRRGGRPWRISPRSPSQPNPLSSASAFVGLRSRTSSRKPSSTVARLVVKPVAVMAWDNNSSSISMLVRIAAGPIVHRVYRFIYIYTFQHRCNTRSVVGERFPIGPRCATQAASILPRSRRGAAPGTAAARASHPACPSAPRL